MTQTLDELIATRRSDFLKRVVFFTISKNELDLEPRRQHSCQIPVHQLFVSLRYLPDKATVGVAALRDRASGRLHAARDAVQLTFGPANAFGVSLFISEILFFSLLVTRAL